MCPMIEYWQPILLSAVFCFVASSLIWMALPFVHKHEYKKLGDKEGAVMDAFRSWGLGAGMFVFPMLNPKECKTPEGKAKMANGPWGVMMLRDKPWSMGSTMFLWFVNLLLISTCVAYVAHHAGLAGKDYLKVFQVVGAVAFLAYGGNCLTNCIWRGHPWNTLPGAVFDALVYACLTGGTFGWLLTRAHTG
jgi:hypothetical protein